MPRGAPRRRIHIAVLARVPSRGMNFLFVSIRHRCVENPGVHVIVVVVVVVACYYKFYYMRAIDACGGSFIHIFATHNTPRRPAHTTSAPNREHAARNTLLHSDLVLQ